VTSALGADGNRSGTPPAERGGPDPDRPAGIFVVLAELGLLAAAFGTAAGFSRLFVGWGFLGSLAVPLVASWGSGVVLRRLRVPVGWAALASLAFAVVVLTWRFAPGTSFLGVPTADSAALIRGELRDSFGEFSRMVAPVEPTDGFLVVLAAVMWVFGFFADTAAFRYRGPVQAVIPYASTFVASGILARESGRTGAALCFVAGMAIYAVTQRTLLASQRRWVRGEAGRGSWAVAGAGAALAVVAVVAGVLVGPQLPGDTQAVVDLRSLGSGGGARTVVSPFVGVRSFLGPQSDQVMFTVQSDTPSYWRLTSLEQYDRNRDIWVSRGTYRRVDDTLDVTSPAGVPTRSTRQTFRIDALGGLWLPAAFQPVRVTAEVPISYDQGSSSVIVRDSSLQQGTTYLVDSEIPGLDAAALSGAVPRAGVDSVYTQDPGLSPSVAALARRVTQGTTTPFQQAMALQTFFRGDRFRYDTTVDYRDAEDPVAAFLAEGRGFCQQFASTFALMARSLGLPARVAVGFTQGDNVARLPSSGVTDDPGFVVRGRHAHAWPEVYFDQVGWVPFEPTTGRGNPQATSYTGVEPAQAEPPPAQAATTTVPATTVAGSPTTPTTTAPGGNGLDAVQDPARADGGRDGSDASGPWPWLAAAAGTVVLALLLARLLLGRRRRQRLRRDPHGGRVAAAWDDAVGWLSVVGLAPERDETPSEFAQRAGRSDVLAAPAADDGGGDSDRAGDSADATAALDELAWAETVRRFGAGVPSDELCASAESAAAVVADRVRSRTSRRQHARHLVR
jgi:transglutaminase-like putative cysteine protease